MRKSKALPSVLLADHGLGWAGGDSYVRNLQRVLERLDNESFLDLLPHKETQLWLHLFPPTFRLKRSKEFEARKFKAIQLPWPLMSGIHRPVQWVPDLQDIEEPAFFSNQERESRKSQIITAQNISTAFYFSSDHARGLFEHCYPDAKTLGILRFTVRKDRFSPKLHMTCDNCISEGFYYVPNSWWKHKNHLLLLSAFQEYQKNGGKKHLILTGTQGDYRWPSYADEVRSVLEKTAGAHNLGFCTVEQKASLYRETFCVIQPSLYEGWSTTVEEALIYNKKIIVSDLPIFEEQLAGENGFKTFRRRHKDDLLEAMFATEAQNVELLDRNYFNRENRFYADAKNLITSARHHLESIF